MKEKVDSSKKDVMIDRVGKCTGGLAAALMSGTVKYFDADNVDDPSKELTVPAEPQSKCEISMQYMKCLAAAEKQSDCPVFTFP
ncbi:unnamed protein product [Acanthoscelides obtectus]|nr:unnamed protein product [Acanthoscelides obtectus]CAK1622845.1 hypothetical protein AOBTE_LOCUS1695 [Acanthoscelides obtectus]